MRNGPNLGDDVLGAAASWLAEELANSLGQETSAYDYWFDLNPEVAYSTCKVTSLPVQALFAISWEAVMTLKVTSDKPPSVSATVFLFSGGDRLGRFAHYGSDYLQMVWDDTGWGAPVWLGDEFGEWEDILHPHGVESSTSELVGQLVPRGEFGSGAHMLEGVFQIAWTTTIVPDTRDERRIVLSILGERVGRLVDHGNSYVFIALLASGDWAIRGWMGATTNITMPFQ